MVSLSRGGIIEFMAGIAISISLVTLSLIIAEGHTPSLNDAFKHFKNYKVPVHYTLATIIFTLIILCGFAAVVAILGTFTTASLSGYQPMMTGILIVSALVLAVVIYFAVRLQFYKFLIIEDDNLNALDSLKKSMRMTRGGFWKLFGFFVMITVINIIGAIPFGLGLIVTLPVSLIAYAVVYKKFKNHGE
jgi:uncharacterized membrane protein